MNSRRKFAAVITALVCAGAVQAAFIPEPSTVLYGKVTGVGGVQPFLIDSGSMQCTLELSTGSNVVLEAALQPLNDGEFSYRLDIPHTALSFGLQPDNSGIPLPPVASTNVLVSVRVDGQPAEFNGPSSEALALGQLLRAQSYRLDLVIDRMPIDTDGDGLPDWWEDQMGLDKQNAADGAMDPDGDGILNPDEYKLGLNPLHDDRNPSLLTHDLLVYADNRTGIHLESFDADAVASNRIYTLTQLPQYGSLQWIEGTGSNTVLEVGSSFSQADVDLGRLVFAQSGELNGVEATQLGLVLRDGVSGASTEALVPVNFWTPLPQSGLSKIGALRQAAYRAGRTDGMILWDSATALGDTTRSVWTADTNRHYFVEGRGDDTFAGADGSDIFVSRQGLNRYTGMGGADRFHFSGDASGTNFITDFAVAEGDVLDLSEKLSGRSGTVNESIQFTVSGTDTLVAVDDLQVVLQNTQIDDVLAYDLINDGHIQVGNLKLVPRIRIEATDAVASENGNNSALFTVEREGDWSQPLHVDLAVQGVALNGVDYSSIMPYVDFAAGQRSVQISIRPFADSELEADEIVELTILAGTGYRISSADRATAVIKDLQSVVGIEILEPLATVNPIAPGAFAVTRSGQLANSLFVRLQIAGSAGNGLDYTYVSTFISFQPGQSVVPVQVTPLATAVLQDGAEVMDVSIVPDASYALADTAEGRITLVGHRDTLGQWMTREFPGSTESLSQFATADRDGLGVNHLLRYAYGLDPQHPDRTKLPSVVMRNGHMTVDVHRNPEATDITLIVEVSDDLIHWRSSTSDIRRIRVPELAQSALVETYEVVPLVETESAKFVRVRVEQH